MNDIYATNVNLLVALELLLAERSVTRAASRFGITQSSMSGALAQLREMFDDALLVRVGNRMEPTPRALALADRLGSGVAAFRSVLEEPAPFDPATSRERFTLVMSDLAELALLTELMGRLAVEAPGVSVQVLPWSRYEVYPGLATGEADLMVGIYDPQALPNGHRERPLFPTKMVSIIRGDHPALEGGELAFERWLELSHIVVTEKPGAQGVVDDILEKRGLERLIAVRTPHFAQVPLLVAGSDLTAATEWIVAERFAAWLPLHVFEPPVQVPPGSVGMIWHERTQADAPCDWLRGILMEVAAPLIELTPVG